MSKQSASFTPLHTWLPHHLLSLFIGWLSNWRWQWGKNRAIRWFIKHFGVDMTEAEQPDYTRYATFNDFFTRHLKSSLRPIDPNPRTIVSPVDGCVSEIGQLHGKKLLQAKGKWYDLIALLGGDHQQAALFEEGFFLTAYLAPKDYHRIHMPIEGRLLKMTHVPGRLFSVNAQAVLHVNYLFARNERVVCLFETAVGPMVMVIIGAMLVGGIVTVWHGRVTPPTRKKIRSFTYIEKNINFSRGEEIGHFKMGSTVIVLFPKNSIQWGNHLKTQVHLKFGEIIADSSPETYRR